MPGLLPDLVRFGHDHIRPTAAKAFPIRRIVILTWGENPTFDYYIRSRMAGIDATVVDLTHRDAAVRTTLRAGDYVLICRYLNRRWAQRLAKTAGLAGVGLLFDDDYVAFLGDTTVPLLYRLDVARRTVNPLRIISERLTDVFVSTPTLQERFVESDARLLPPSPLPQDLEPVARPDGTPIRIAFHAQLSHLADHELAAEIAGTLGESHRPVIFDIIGPAKTRRLWKGVPHVRFEAEMSWPEYRQRSRTVGADILIAPMHDSRLNQARAPTKAIDAVRMGAAAILPSSPAYRDLHGSAVFVDGGVEDWCRAIRDLIKTPDELRGRAELLRAEVSRWTLRAVPLTRVIECGA